MATPDTDFGADPQDSAETFDETHSTDEDVSPDETRSFAPDLFDDVYDVTKADGDEDEDEDDGALDAADYDPDDLEDEDDEDDATGLYLDDDFDDGDEDEDEEDDILASSADDADLEYTDDLDDAGRTNNRMARRYESSGELSEEQVADLGYGDRAPTGAGSEAQGSGASADDVEDESDPRQEQLLDQGIEESFPASDPVSVKRIT